MVQWFERKSQVILKLLDTILKLLTRRWIVCADFEFEINQQILCFYQSIHR